MTLREQIASYLSDFQAFHVLRLGDRDRLGNILLDRLWLLDEKISRSGFQPAQKDDPLQKGFPVALDRWVRSFAPEAMAGALILGLTVDYFTEEELGHLLSNCAKSFSESHPNESAVKNEYDIYQLTRATDIHARFRRSLGVGDIHRSGVQPVATIEEAIFKAATLLGSLAGGGDELLNSPYYSSAELIKTFAGRQIVLIEDWSLSGTTLAKNVERLYKLWSIVFSQKFVGQLSQAYGFGPPRLTLVVMLTTDVALERMEKAFKTLPGLGLLSPPESSGGVRLRGKSVLRIKQCHHGVLNWILLFRGLTHAV
jgi:hypothetical protein